MTMTRTITILLVLAIAAAAIGYVAREWTPPPGATHDWCAEHGVPESECLICNPSLAAAMPGDAAGPGWHYAAPDAEIVTDVVGDVPRAHRSPSVTCETERSLVRLASPEVARRAGLELETVRRAPLAETIEAPAHLAYDARRHARLSARAPGIVTEVRVDLGARVGAGDVLVVVDAPELGAARAALLAADARVRLWARNDEREQGLLERGLTTEREALAAQTELVEARIARQAACQRLSTLGLGEDAIDAVLASGDAGSRLAVTAPFDGVVVGLGAVVGEPAREGDALVGVADTSRVWAMLDVAPREARHVAPGDPVLLVAQGTEDRTLGGRVTWIGAEVDARTRTVTVRAELDNPDGELRAGSFGTARVVTRAGDEAVLVPKDAVQWEGCCNVAFVPRSETEYVPRVLRLGIDTGDAYEVLAGLDGGEAVVTQGSFLLKTELRKGSIGAGCCVVDHLGG